MAFMVPLTGADPEKFDDQDELDVTKGGALEITREDKSTVYFSPSAWVRIDKTRPPQEVPRRIN